LNSEGKRRIAEWKAKKDTEGNRVDNDNYIYTDFWIGQEKELYSWTQCRNYGQRGSSYIHTTRELSMATIQHFEVDIVLITLFRQEGERNLLRENQKAE